MDRVAELLQLMPTIRRMARAFHRRFHWHHELQVDDLVQEGSIAVWNALPNADRDSKERYWAYLNIRIRGAFFDYLRTLSAPADVTMIALDSLELSEQDSLLVEKASVPDSAISDFEDAFKRLSHREKYIMSKAAWGEELKRIGAQLGLSESRVSQILTQARKKLFQ